MPHGTASSSGPVARCDMRVTGYSERGAVNALLYEIAYSKKPLRLLEHFLSLAHFPQGKQIGSGLTDAHVLVEQSLSDFGDADAILLLDAGGAKTAVFLEAKVKTAQANSWTLAQEFEDFESGCNTIGELSSSNLFTQLYHKARLIDGLRSGGVPLLQNGLPFLRPSTRPIRRIGATPIVLRAVGKIIPYQANVWFLSLVPDTPTAVRRFFDEFPAMAWPLRPDKLDSSRWGGVAWKQIEEFCQQENLTNTSRVLEFNSGQIF